MHSIARNKNSNELTICFKVAKNVPERKINLSFLLPLLLAMICNERRYNDDFTHIFNEDGDVKIDFV
jgi:hypothetical protein